ncbi:SigB/SigF/SigG family RNA polymerase sigma factor [Streptomyces sp. DK15]|uniref:SigB/SigF/SigG family RNA polymerase sigma factor n=2 Tax=unclassified Streptomyces TaxID=2593676 RepID=UPI0029B965F5|nr:SigB/SigF/SigG family RNA polymerase sigma factor [Streptomyces sp. DK15]MDX2389218.1 SigB/SigF/SigG family RNA polymerase sigma factor [Streptomyces sp. DK15]
MDTLTTRVAVGTTGAVTGTTRLPEGLPRIAEPREVAPEDARALSRTFFERLRTLDEGTRERQYVRNTLIEMNLSLVQFAARRFRNRTDGTDIEDIIQVGTIGLIKAIDRFDPALGNEFATLALPYITGEIKRHFRDTTWAVRVPRRLQELRIELARGKEELHAVLDRAPTVRELAEHLELTDEEVVEGLVAANGHSSQPLDSEADESSERAVRPLAEVLGNEDPALELFEDFRTLAPLLEGLAGRDRLILRMRFGQEMTQAQIGERLGISQMQISRILTRTLTRLREGMLAD